MCGCLSCALPTPPTGDLVCNPGICPDWELNRLPFGSQADAQSTEPHQLGLSLPTLTKVENYPSLGQVVKYLLDSNAKPDEKDLSGSTPLLYACSSGHHEVAALLLQVRAPTALGAADTGQ